MGKRIFNAHNYFARVYLNGSKVEPAINYTHQTFIYRQFYSCYYDLITKLRNNCVRDDHVYAPFVVVSFNSFFSLS